MDISKKYYFGKEQDGGQYVFRVLPVLPEAPIPNLRVTPLKYGAPTGVRFLPIGFRPDDEAYVRIQSGPFRYHVRTPASNVRSIMRDLRCTDINYRGNNINNNLRNFIIEVPKGKFEVYMSWNDIHDFISKIENNWSSNNQITIIRELGNGKQMTADEAMTELQKMYP